MSEELAIKKDVPFSVELSEKLDSVKDTLPKGFNQPRFVQNAMSVLNEKPELAEVGKAKLFAGLLKGASLGLDFYNKQCYLIPRTDKSGVKHLDFQLDYKGCTTLCKKYSIRPLVDIHAQVVREGDSFQLKVDGNDTKVLHTSNPFDGGKVIGAYAVAQFKDGGSQVEVMTLDEINMARSKSKTRGQVWNEWFNEMAKKTVIHRLAKHIDIDFENAIQQNLFNDDCAIETDVKEQTKKDIEEVEVVAFNTEVIDET